MSTEQKEIRYVMCIRNNECDDLEVRKVYEVLPDSKAQEEGYLRISDESGEDYLYPEDYFVPVRLPKKAVHAMAEK